MGKFCILFNDNPKIRWNILITKYSLFIFCYNFLEQIALIRKMWGWMWEYGEEIMIIIYICGGTFFRLQIFIKTLCLNAVTSKYKFWGIFVRFIYANTKRNNQFCNITINQWMSAAHCMLIWHTQCTWIIH